MAAAAVLVVLVRESRLDGTICVIGAIRGYLSLPGECLHWSRRFSAGSNHIKGLMCHVGLATLDAAWKRKARRRTMRLAGAG